MTTERRKGSTERRKGDRRKQEFYCFQCGGSLRYYIPKKITDKEIYWCEGCQQMYVLVSQHMEVPYLAKVK